MKKYLVPVILVLGAAVGGACLSRFSKVWTLSLLLLMSVLPLLAIVVVSGAIGLADKASGKRPFHRRGYLGYLALVCLAGIVIFFHLKRVFFRHDALPAQNFAVSLIPQLEKYRQATGRFPEKLSDAAIAIPDTASFRLLRYRSYYGDEFSFSMHDGFSGEYRMSYNGTLHDWHRNDR